MNVLLTFFSLFLSSGPLTRDHHIELEAKELAKRHHGEKRGNVTSNKGRKQHTKKETATVVEEPALLLLERLGPAAKTAAHSCTRVVSPYL